VPEARSRRGVARGVQADACGRAPVSRDRDRTDDRHARLCRYER
jgi:hypothetical protein